jgi:hypothetical protein
LNTFFPLEFYSIIYYNFLLLLTFIVFFQSQSTLLESAYNLKNKSFIGLLLLLTIIFYIGLRPVNYRFGDMVIYNLQFNRFANGYIPKYEKDVLFEFFLYQFSKLGSATFFFFTCFLLYILPLFAFAKKMFKDYWFYAFYILVISFSFWAYGTNGIRNGIATSVFLYGLSHKNKTTLFLILLLSVFIHKSLSIPFGAFFIAKYYNKPKVYLIFWFLAIPLSLVLGGFWEGFFMKFGFGNEDRLTGYFTSDQKGLDAAVKVGFRWDFLLYSATGVFAGWYYIVKKKFEDLYYNNLYGVYLITNALWVLVIRANFSNRFAYLSWFMLGIVIIYPLLKVKMVNNQNKVLGTVLLCYFAFTYIMNVILAK